MRKKKNKNIHAFDNFSILAHKSQFVIIAYSTYRVLRVNVWNGKKNEHSSTNGTKSISLLFFSAPTNLYKKHSCIYIFIARQSYTPFNHDYSFVSYHYKNKPKFLVKASGPRAQVAPTFLFFFPSSYPSFPVADNNILIIIFTWNLRVFCWFLRFYAGIILFLCERLI